MPRLSSPRPLTRLPSRLRFALVALTLVTLRAATPPLSLPADHPALRFSDFVRKEILPDGAVRFDRILEVPERGYRWDNPGARVSFRTNARGVTVRLRYSEKHTSTSARAPVGVFMIDGQTDPAWTFTSRARQTVRPVEDLALELPIPPGSGFHDYAIVMPYGDAVDFLGLTVSGDAKFEAPPERPAKRYLAYGDSVTHGFTATHIGHTYPFLLAESRGWQLVNLGLGGRSARAAEGETIGQLHADLITLLIGVNDWQGGITPDDYRQAMRGLLNRIRALQPTVPIYAITPLWVSPHWQPAKAQFPLETYRQALRELVGESHDSALHLVEGPTLIDADERYFDAVQVHPNDAGFAQMAARLDRAIAPLPSP